MSTLEVKAVVFGVGCVVGYFLMQTKHGCGGALGGAAASCFLAP